MSEPKDSTANPLAEGRGRRKTASPCALVLFGATGDLARRKLIPALYNLCRDGHLPAKYAVIGIGRRPLDDREFRARMREAVEGHARLYRADEAVCGPFCESLFYHRADFDDPAGYRSLRARLERIEDELGLPGSRLHYLATAPEHFAPIVQSASEAGLTPAGDGGERWSRVVVEKPVGHDLESARALNRALLAVLDEGQVYRIDHYLGKETVQNLLALRFANGILEPLWNRKYVDHVQITVAESIGVGGRGGYYDGAGAIRDMVQNHLLQLLCLVAMEPPASIGADAVRSEKVKVLEALRRIPPEEVDRFVVRGQYREGSILGEHTPAYTGEDGVPEDSRTETYVALRAGVENWRWAGVPFLLRSGKRLPKRVTEVCVQFRKPPLSLFDQAAASDVAPNALTINIQPDEGISLRFGAKIPGPEMRVRPVKMDFRYGSSFGVPSPEAYERLLLDAMAGDSTLFTRRDEVEAQWRFVTDILEGWERSGGAPHPYAAGSWGPAEADRLAADLEGGWRRL